MIETFCASRIKTMVDTSVINVRCKGSQGPDTPQATLIALQNIRIRLEDSYA